MENLTKISVEQCCIYYKIELSFIQKLDQHGLISLITSGEGAFITYEQLNDLEKYIHFHYDLEINMEGIETVVHLLERIKKLQQEVKILRNYGQEEQFTNFDTAT
ncbi:chaperone modulator CbpM [Pedobacter riviphilus]|uniref:Chaperone modulator CbpM n=1 Tax=Pedobacter riviphilus TaxID=2766984 RepID=A0ABX6TN37_9SPHI|nr:chaperone modulator CbpM [Pedobacter riviphilus]QNR86989.1 chaperone modulator CbpM [Pedobacter riviphilus]